MEHDITSLVIEAQDARSRMQEAKKRIKAEVRRKYEAAMKRDTAEAIQDAEIEFARTLARVNASGVSISVMMTSFTFSPASVSRRTTSAA